YIIFVLCRLDGIVDSATLSGQVLQDEDTKRGKADAYNHLERLRSILYVCPILDCILKMER
ncbi:MAG: hypothetical protein EBS13_09130, partial [Verrucomicrobia bacterium]|nr:hypothetical protein [Verrucomicrobiota bacterium]